jgi:hypothetical protein
MYDAIINEGYDSVGTRRVTRKGEPPIRSFFARMFYKIINKMSDIEMLDGARDYRLMKRQVVDAIISLKEYVLSVIKNTNIYLYNYIAFTNASFLSGCLGFPILSTAFTHMPSSCQRYSNALSPILTCPIIILGTSEISIFVTNTGLPFLS